MSMFICDCGNIDEYANKSEARSHGWIIAENYRYCPSCAALINRRNGATDKRADNATVESASSEKTRTEQEMELLQCFRELSPYLQGVAVDTVRSWADRPDGGSLHKKA